ncbi:hypothetical protein [Arthrobacter sp. B3I4]|uniref:hypothetical protein n=1 Tax=Arthrobacter sp. B3I4 TaxID=3042267 RepID=UPI0027826B0F|nr:hypothetical protein [Arthrobacter sp. B3I4]MDQ0754232.1 hypothetical protein [Arthrobacter sp. B3I4]
MAPSELAGIAAQLYALPFDDFIPGRTAAAKELLAGQSVTTELRSRAAEVRALPKPSVSAWAVNMLAWHRPETLGELAGLGLAMRQAQDALDAPRLRSLAGERRRVLADTVGAARKVAEQQGRKISGAIASEVEETLRAATADEGAAAAVRSGRLLRALSANGVDAAELTGAIAVPEAPPAAPAAAGTAGTVPARGRTAKSGDSEDSGGSSKNGDSSNNAGAAEEAGPAQGQPRLRAVRQERLAPSPSAWQRAEAALQQAADAAKSSAAEEQRTASERDDAVAEAAALTEEAARLKEDLARAEDGLRRARKRLDSATAAAQQAARAADKDRRREDLARERVLRLGNTPGR